MAFESSYTVSALHNPRQKKTDFFFGGGGFVLLKSFLCISIRYILIEGNVDWLYNSKCRE